MPFLNSLPDSFYTFKKVVIIPYFKFFHQLTLMNLIKLKERNALTNNISADCVSLKNTNYILDIKTIYLLRNNNKNHAK